MHTMSMLCSVSSGSRPIPFEVLTLSVAICTILLHLGDFCLSQISADDFSNNLSRTRPLLTHAKGNVVWTYGLGESHGNLLMAVFFTSFIFLLVFCKGIHCPYICL